MQSNKRSVAVATLLFIFSTLVSEDRKGLLEGLPPLSLITFIPFGQ